jgi:hypothetical protein
MANDHGHDAPLFPVMPEQKREACFRATKARSASSRFCPAMTKEETSCSYSAERAFAIFRKHSRHRQSSPSTGIGSRAVSSAHQHVPDKSHANSVPQPEQARRRESGFSNRFVINRSQPRGCFSCPVHAERRYTRSQYTPRDS